MGRPYGLVLAASAAALQGQPVLQGIGPMIETAMKLGPTIFPILFAALVGKMLKNVGRYYVEKGRAMGTLWRLMNVRTMFDAATSPVQLRETSVVAVLLIVLWSLSPLGGQAVLRLVHHFNETTTETVPLRYVYLGAGGSLVVQNYYLNLFESVVPIPTEYTFGSTLLQTQEVRADSRDNWGNVKIPRIERLDESSANVEGWFEVPFHDRTAETYSSLMGIPIVGVPRQGTTDMSLESSYVSLSCEPTKISRNGSLQNGFVARCDDCEYDDMFGVWMPKTNARANIVLGFRDLTETEKHNASFTAPRRITFLSGSGQRSALPEEVQTGTYLFNVTTSTTCAVTQSLVEYKVSCEQGDCAVTAMRRSQTDSRNPNFTAFDHWAVAVLEQITRQFSRSPSFTQSSNMIEYFLNDTSKIPVNEALVDLSRVPSPLIAERAAMVLNTYIQLFHTPMAFAGNLPSGNLSLYGPEHIPAQGVDFLDADYFFEQLRREHQRLSNVYRPEWFWVGILFLASTTRIVAGTIGIVLGVQAKAPDMFDPAIGLTYDNRHLDVAELKLLNPLNVTERARLLDDVVVRLGDAQGETL
ncbi:hypothetical protein PG994_007618 [Apiospora phragmitis]|uniref:Uncharacterized protein n=1 Tax=Apiospora phragmitis TaxID=2905665 RepID=A0ABR1URF4_9PEZI